jgi:hypothetical protein
MKDTSAIVAAPPNFYNGPDVFNPALEPPENSINYLAIVENDAKRSPKRRQLASHSTPDSLFLNPSVANESQRSLSSDRSLIQGHGWSLHTKAGDSHCDGTWDSECGRGTDERCLLSGHNDGRGGLLFDSYSGWLVLNLKNLKEGIIIVKFESWHGSGANELTEGWTAENNGAEGRRRLGMVSSYRELKSTTPDFCDDFVFEYAIDGDIHSLNKKEFMSKRVLVQRVVETLTLLDDPNVTSNEVDVELGIRMRGCQRVKTFSLTHVYWA